MTITHKGHPLFLWTNSHLTLGCPAGLSSSLMCSPQPLLPVLLPLLPRRPGQQLPDGAPPRRLGRCRQGAPASNKPHPAEKSTPVWLAIWRTWAGFANSQLLPDAAALSSMQGLPWSGNSSAQTSASLHPPAALRLQVLPFTRTWSSTVCAEEFPTPLEMSLHGLPLLRHSKSVGPSAPIAYATSVSPPNEAAARQGCRC